MSEDLSVHYGGGRMTAARATIARVVEALPGAFTVDDLACAVRAQAPEAGATATVYRAVASMESAGTLERVGTRDGATLFALCDAGSHHHHIVCDGCGRTAPMECPVVHLDTSERPDGFIITRHEVTLYGLCPVCAAGEDC